jgi:hypothetical protein
LGKEIIEQACYNYGCVLVCKQAFSYYTLDKLLVRAQKKAKLQFSLVNTILLMLCERLQEPVSKRRTFFNQRLDVAFLEETIDRLEAFFYGMAPPSMPASISGLNC